MPFFIFTAASTAMLLGGKLFCIFSIIGFTTFVLDGGD